MPLGREFDARDCRCALCIGRKLAHPADRHAPRIMGPQEYRVTPKVCQVPFLFDDIPVTIDPIGGRNEGGHAAVVEIADLGLLDDALGARAHGDSSTSAVS